MIITTVHLIINLVLSKTTIFIVYYENNFNCGSVFNDFSRVSFTTIVIAVYLMFNDVLLNNYDSSACNK